MDPAIEGRVLEAAIELVQEVDYPSLGVRDIAARAGVGVGAIYRRWETKESLVVAAMERMLLTDSPPDAVDIRSWLDSFAQRFEARKEALRTMIGTLGRQTDLVSLVRTQLVEPELARARLVIADELGTDEDDPVVGLIAELGPAAITLRLLVLHDEPAAELGATVQRIIDLVSAGLTVEQGEGPARAGSPSAK